MTNDQQRETKHIISVTLYDAVGMVYEISSLAILKLKALCHLLQHNHNLKQRIEKQILR
jgi:hypothetical protein